MRIECPYCGDRSLDEFVYSGDATVNRPQEGGPDAVSAFTDYVYIRTNPSGLHRELWYHAAGCHAWLVVTRGVSTHAITSVEAASDVASKERSAGKDGTA